MLPHERVHTLKERALHPFRRTGSDVLRALQEVSFEVPEGEFFGIVGRNGSGKSTLLKCLAGIYRVDRGEIRMRGRLSTFIELGVGFNPDLAARDNVLINGIMLGLSPRQALRRFDAHHRVRRARGVRRPEAQELLLGHAGAARIQRDEPRGRRCAAHRRGAGGGRRRLPAEVLRRLPPAPGGGEDDPLRDPRHGRGGSLLRPRHAARARPRGGDRGAGDGRREVRSSATSNAPRARSSRRTTTIESAIAAPRSWTPGSSTTVDGRMCCLRVKSVHSGCGCASTPTSTTRSAPSCSRTSATTRCSRSRTRMPAPSRGATPPATRPSLGSRSRTSSRPDACTPRPGCSTTAALRSSTGVRAW